MLPDIEFLQELTNKKQMEDIILRKKIAEEFINLASTKEQLIQRAKEGYCSASLFIPPEYMSSFDAIKTAFKNADYELLTPGSYNEIRVTWYKEDLA